MGQHGLALDAVLAEVQHLGHRIVRAVDDHLREGFQPFPQAQVQGAHSSIPALHGLVQAGGRSSKAQRIGQVLGAGTLLPLLLTAQIGSLERLIQAVAQVERTNALGCMDLVSADSQCVDVRQLDGHPHPGLHGIHMDDGAAVAALDLGGQTLHIVPGADLIVDHHAGHKDGVFVHMVQHPVDVQRAVRAGVHHGHIIAHGGQTLQRLLHAGVLKTGHHDALAEPAGQSRAQQGHVVALAAAGGKIELPALAAQGAGHGGTGGVQGFLAPGTGGIQTGRVGPVLPHGLVDDIRHFRGHDGGGGVVQIMQFRVLQHKF